MGKPRGPGGRLPPSKPPFAEAPSDARGPDLPVPEFVSRPVAFAGAPHARTVGEPRERLRFHVGERGTDALARPNARLDEMVGDWREYLVEPDADEALCRVRREKSVGRLLGSAAFVRKREEELGRFLTRRPLGRPLGRPRKRRQD